MAIASRMISIVLIGTAALCCNVRCQPHATFVRASDACTAITTAARLTTTK